MGWLKKAKVKTWMPQKLLDDLKHAETWVVPQGKGIFHKPKATKKKDSINYEIAEAASNIWIKAQSHWKCLDHWITMRLDPMIYIKDAYLQGQYHALNKKGHDS